MCFVIFQFKVNMKIRLLIILATIPIIIGCNNDGPSMTGKPVFKTFEDSLSYALGVQLGMNTRRDSLNLNFDNYAKGYKAGKDSANIMFPDSIMSKVISQLQQKLQEKQAKQELQIEQQRQEKSKELEKTNDQFLADFKTKSGVKISKSGLMWEIIKEGTGQTPKPDDILKIKFIASFSNGEVFDSMAKNNPVEFPVRGLFPGWEEATRNMKVGGKYRFVFPPELAFGQRGSGPIPPNAIIIFEMELLDAKKVEMPANMQVQPLPPDAQPIPNLPPPNKK